MNKEYSKLKSIESKYEEILNKYNDLAFEYAK